MVRFSSPTWFAIPLAVRNAIGADTDWPRQWTKPEPKSDYDVIIIVVAFRFRKSEFVLS